ncbi:hypothetical protein [Algoriphagus sp. NG3]|uniref:hypothetical protein n=1 Tax=Algoriphagus sp. NG3 TaxID=3097546 RepID=UPI002A83A208|nr:hypothetical protein [Algoriphagus sp. NG3]WPR75998.1 hypothetical protein SLW71_01370 [Algoriphagus sp. NG3]
MRKTVIIFRISLLVIFGSLLVTSCATTKKVKPIVSIEETDWKKMDLKGHIKSIQETSTSKYPEEKPKVETSKSDFNTYGKLVFSDSYGHVFENKYNSKGQIVESREYMGGNLINKDIYTYSAEGKKTGKSRYQSPTFLSEEEWEAHQAKIPSLPNEGLYLQNKLEIHEDGNQTITVYKQNSEVDYVQKEIYENSKLVELTVKYPSSDAFGYKKTWEFDDSNNLARFKKYVAAEERLEIVWEYDYDEKNRITKETHLRYMPKSSSTFNQGHLKDYTKGYYLDENLSYISSFQYDENGSLTSEIAEKYNGEFVREISYELTYDSNQNLTQENVHDSKKGSTNNSIEYDKNGNEIFYKSVDTNGDLISKVTRKFDSYSNMTERVVYDSDESISLSESYVYDTDGNVTEHIIRKPLEETIEITTHDYDDIGNWVRFELKLLSSETNEAFQTVIKEREIIYYD